MTVLRPLKRRVYVYTFRFIMHCKILLDNIQTVKKGLEFPLFTPVHPRLRRDYRCSSDTMKPSCCLPYGKADSPSAASMDISRNEPIQIQQLQAEIPVQCPATDIHHLECAPYVPPNLRNSGASFVHVVVAGLMPLKYPSVPVTSKMRLIHFSN